MAVTVLTTGAIGAFDYATGPRVSFLAFYLLPTAWVTARLGRRAGMAAAVLSGVVALAANDLLRHDMHDPDTQVWNMALRIVTFVVVVELVHRVREEARAARDAERRSREFLAAAAHQLRTPLAGIRSTVDALLVGGGTSPEQEHLLLNLSRESSRAGRHLSSLLRMARLDQREEVPLRRTRLDGLVHNELERAASTRPGLMWELSRVAGDTELDCNPDSIGEAVANLLDNAGRHARSRVDATVSAGDGYLEIAISDDGPGLPPGSSAAAFDRFVSLDHCGGTGLGLPIARAIAEAHRGTLDYTKGAFVIRLPVARAAPGRAPVAREAPRRSPDREPAHHL
ncbi:MAG TPA: HAMP domain-containing sensor histidine kinase [Acidimicrobiales bacterium]|nr:HAMP domain-containing sensor histidine kinase [Acidimicrobiales bacterium]